MDDRHAKIFPNKAMPHEVGFISFELFVLRICSICGMLHVIKQTVINNMNISVIFLGNN